MRLGRSFRPRAQRATAVGPPPQQAGKQRKVGRWQRQRAALWSGCFCLPRLSPWAPAAEKVHRTRAGLKLAPLCSANPVCGLQSAEARLGSADRGPSSLARQPRERLRPRSWGRLRRRRPRASNVALAKAAFPPSAADQVHRAAVSPGPGAVGARGLPAQKCWSLDRARRGAGPPETDREGMLQSVLPRPRRGHCCLLSGRLNLLSFKELGRRPRTGRLGELGDEG